MLPCLVIVENDRSDSILSPDTGGHCGIATRWLSGRWHLSSFY